MRSGLRCTSLAAIAFVAFLGAVACAPGDRELCNADADCPLAELCQLGACVPDAPPADGQAPEKPELDEALEDAVDDPADPVEEPAPIDVPAEARPLRKGQLAGGSTSERYVIEDPIVGDRLNLVAEPRGALVASVTVRDASTGEVVAAQVAAAGVFEAETVDVEFIVQDRSIYLVDVHAVGVGSFALELR